MKNLFALILLSLTFLSSNAQGVYDDFIYTRQAVTERKVVEWPYLREADVLWTKRIWRVIDVRQKQNQPMNWPKNPLNVIIYNAILSGKLTAYSSDSLAGFMSAEDFKNFGSGKEVIKKLIDPEGEEDDLTNITYDTIPIVNTPDKIKKYKIVEDWIFDKKESRMYVRIIAIAPMIPYTVAGQEGEDVEWAWLKYHKDPSDADVSDVRSVLVNMEVFNRQNDAARLTYDDWFEQRMFTSYIVKESNPYDMAINQFADFKDNGEAALLEADRIKNELFEKEHDLWEY